METLTSDDLSKEVLELENISEEKASAHKLVAEEKLAKIKKFSKAGLVTEILKTLALVPSERKSMKELQKDFEEVEAELGEKFNERSFKAARGRYLG